MSHEEILTALGLLGAFMLSLLSVGVLFGKLFQRVDTLEKDLNQAFKMIRNQTKE